tara:strand:- start:70364 stop:71374 length:1011 start_codon:yes stop_codon:yes gene_type:complete
MRNISPSEHDLKQDGKTAILLTNLGTPSAPTHKALRKYLKQFLWDKRVVEVPRPIWWMILNLFILPLRPFIIAKKYRDIWTEQGSPLLLHTQTQAKKLQALMGSDQVIIEYAMRYGEPSIDSAMERLRKQSIRKLIVLPLYPQYAASTIASTFDAVAKELNQWRFLPQITFISGYTDFPPYIEAIANSIQQHWQEHGKAEKLLLSFHGLPKRNLELGDPYYCFCHKTSRLIAEKLELNQNDWEMVFQSRFGKAEWLQPYCEQTLIEFAETGIKTVDVICPGFAADCLETLEEISETYAEVFRQHGGVKLRYIPALNASDEHIAMLQQLLQQHMETL